MTSQQTLNLRVRSIREAAARVHVFELVDDAGGSLPGFTAGAHLSLTLPVGLTRSYSLINPQHETSRYEVAVNLDARSRGGSRCLHEAVRVGQCLPASAPQNLFPLNEQAGQSLFIAGGIGITPIRAMVRRLDALGRDWTLHYCARSRREAAFVDEFEGDARVRLYFDDEAAQVGASRLDIVRLLADTPATTHVYCCGPAGMLDAYLSAASSRPADTVHYERFGAELAAPVNDGGYRVTLARSGKSLPVPPGKTVLQVLREAGLSPASSCEQGVCGSCETAVLAGRPEHRDQVLTSQERAAGRSMMICCSGCLDDELVLDL